MTQAEIDASYRAWYRQTWPHHVLAAPRPYYSDLTIDLITREATRLFRNSNWFLRTVGAEFDEQFAAHPPLDFKKARNILASFLE